MILSLKDSYEYVHWDMRLLIIEKNSILKGNPFLGIYLGIQTMRIIERY